MLLSAAVTQHGGGTDYTEIRVSTETEMDPGEGNSPAAPTGIRLNPRRGLSFDHESSAALTTELYPIPIFTVCCVLRSCVKVEVAVLGGSRP